MKKRRNKKMSKIKLSPQQQKAVDAKGHNILVSAGAGSGKTQVLSKRVEVCLTERNYDLNELLILTFTNDAAYNMRERIKKTFAGDEKLKKYIDLVDSSDICTFDSFVQKLIRKYGFLDDFSADFTILDQGVETVLFNKHYEEVIDEYFDKEFSSYDKLYQILCFGKDIKIKSFVENIYRKEAILADISYRDKLLQSYAKQEDLDLLYFIYHTFVNEFFGKLICLITDGVFSFDKPSEAALLLINSCRELCLEYEKNKNDLTFAHCEYFVNNIVEKFQFNIRSFTKSDKKDELKELKEFVNDFKKKKSSKLLSFDELRSYYDDFIFVLKELFKIVDRINNRINLYKSEHRSYTFNDLALYAIKLLQKNLDVCKELKERYKEIMIDEYQDTSDMQENLIKLFANNNLFCVGDIKQSIYRFREANPKLFLEKYDSYKEFDPLNLYTEGQVIPMNQNYRSSSQVISDINSIFLKLLLKEYGGINYQEEAHQLSSANPVYRQKVKDGLLPEENYLITYSDEDLKSIPGIKSHQVQSVYIAKDIKAKLEKDCHFDNEVRKYKFSDFAIITKDKSSYDEIINIFKHFQIPVINKAGIDTYDMDLTRILMNIVRFSYYVSTNNLVSNEDYIHTFYSISRSFLFELQDYEIIKTIDEDKIKDSELFQKVRTSIFKTGSKSIKTKVLTIFNHLGVFQKLYKLSNPVESLVIYNNFIAELNSFDSQNYDFEEYFSYLKELKKLGNIKTETKFNFKTEDAVTLINVHKSKGLEYNVVYFLNFDKKNMNDGNSMFYNNSLKIEGNDYIIGPNLKTPFYDLINQRNKAIDDLMNGKKVDTLAQVEKSLPRYVLNSSTDIDENKHELIRLLYVALTRPKFQFYIFANETKDDFADKTIDKMNSLAKYVQFAKCSSLKSKNIDLTLMQETNRILNDVRKENKFFNYSNIGNNPQKIEQVEFSYKLELSNIKKASSDELIHTSLENVKFGVDLHEYLRYIDFKNPKLELIKDPKVKKIITNFLDEDIVKQYADHYIYKEYRFFNKISNSYNFIDLLMIKGEEAVIIDYKLKNIENLDYVYQLEVYRDYVLNNLPIKSCKIYLYSLVKSKLEEIN